MIHDKICESRKVNSVDFYAENVWVRLLTKSDDNGNYFRDVRRIHANCMLEKDSATEKLTEKAVSTLLKIGLLKEYEADGRKYVHLVDFHDYQELRGDKLAQVEHPVHPSEMGGAYIGEGLRKDVWDGTRSIDEQVQNGNRSESVQNLSRNRTNQVLVGRPEVEVKDKEEVEVQDETESAIASFGEGNYSRFRESWKDAVGCALKPKPFTANTEQYRILCKKNGQEAVLDAINDYVEAHGKHDVAKNKWAVRDFLFDECQDLIEAKKNGTVINAEDRLPRLVVPD